MSTHNPCLHRPHRNASLFLFAGLPAFLCLCFAGCAPQPAFRISDDICWTYFDGFDASEKRPLKLGALKIVNESDRTQAYILDQLRAPFTFPARDSGVVLPGETLRVPLYTEEPLKFSDTNKWQARIQLQYAFKNAEEDKLQQPIIEQRFIEIGGSIRDDLALDSIRDLMAKIDPDFEDRHLSKKTSGLPIGKYIVNSNDLIAWTIPEPPVEGIGKFRRWFDGDAARLFDDRFKQPATVFPCGPGPNGYTVCPEIPASLPVDEEWIVLAQIFDDTVPLADPSRLYQYAFVFDADGNPDNNYVPAPQFPNDYFQGTDLWYALEYSPNEGWRLVVTDARDNVFSGVSSAARAIILGNTILLMVPEGEFSAAQVGYRLTSFCHAGDFGQNPPYDWSADFDPGLDELAPLNLQF